MSNATKALSDLSNIDRHLDKQWLLAELPTDAIYAYINELEAQVAALAAAAEEAHKALAWYVEEDDVYEWMEGNEYWVDGKRAGEKAITALCLALNKEAPKFDHEE